MDRSPASRNAPCPCGSGKQYKHCCGKAGEQPQGLRTIRIERGSHASQADSLENRRYEPMKEYYDKLVLGKGSKFVKSRLSCLSRTEEVWEADIQPISVWGWDAQSHGELWLGMVLTRLESFHLALLASERVPGVNDLADLLAKAMERPWVMGKRRPARLILRNNPRWEELIPHLRQLKIEVECQEELPLWDDAAEAYVRKLRATLRGREVPILTFAPKLDETFPAVARWVRTLGRIEIGVQEGRGSVVRALENEQVVFEVADAENLDDALTALERAIEVRLP